MAELPVHDWSYLSMTGVTCPWLESMTGVACPWLELPVHGLSCLFMAGVTCHWLELPVHGWSYLPWPEVPVHCWSYLSMAGVTSLWCVFHSMVHVPGWCHMHMAGVTCPWLELPVHDWGYLSMAGVTCPSMTNCTRHWW